MMNRRAFLRGAAAGSIGSLWAQAMCAEETAAKTAKLNLLVIMTDQHHAQWLGCAGHSFVKTPNLDRLAKGGMRFTQTFAPVPYCSPTRLAIETGLFPSSLGLGRNIDKGDDPLRLREPQRVYQHPLAERGYACHQLGKWHLGTPAELTCLKADDEQAFRVLMNKRLKAAGAAAFDDGPRDGETEKIGEVWLRKETAEAHTRWQAEKGTPKQDVGVIGRSTRKPEFQYESVLADHCIGLLKRHQSEPFAITYSVSPPHAPWVAPSPYYDLYDPAKLPLPETWKTCPPAWAGTASARMSRIYGEAGLREYLRCYAAQVTMMDACIGRILDALDELKLADKTLVVFTSDHGNMLGQHGLMDKTLGTFYDDLMRVPLLMRLPGVIPAGSTSSAMVSSVDLPTTFLDYLGAAPLPKAHGRTLRGVVEGKDKGNEVVYGERGEPKTPAAARMIRTREWKLCLLPKGAHELYDLTKDPGETRNVYPDPANAGVVKELKERLRKHMLEVGDQADAEKFG